MPDKNTPEDIEEDLGQEQEIPNQKLSWGQKFAAGFLVFFAVFIVIAWMINFKESITGSLVNDKNNSEKQAGVCYGSECQNEEEQLMRKKDTDGDGLNDWEELNVYQTSPYLEDSDSDGGTDKDEIDAGSDPNCPTGRECYDTEQTNNKNEEEYESGEEGLQELLDYFGTEDVEDGSSSSIENTELGEYFKNLDADTLKQLLIEYGMEEEVLNQISDKDLMETFKEVIK